MKKIVYWVIAALCVSVLGACHKESKEEPAWLHERDSLIAVNEQQQMLLDEMTTTMAEIAMGLDSIANHERMIIKRVDEQGHPLNKKNLKEKVHALAGLIQNLREKMDALQQSMENGREAMGQLKNIISYLNITLEQKEVEIVKLQKEIDGKNFSIAQLSSRVSSLQDTVETVRQEKEEQKQELEKIIEDQDVAINEVYYIIGTKKQLLQYGVLSKEGFFKKTKINVASVDKSILTKADKRTLQTILITGKSPKILSAAPKGSFTMENTSEGTLLTILNQDQFWSSNNRILIIQVK